MKWFGTAGIRGKYPEKINAMLLYKVGLSLASYIKNKGSCVVGYLIHTAYRLFLLYPSQ
jgi:phosphomannomutase